MSEGLSHWPFVIAAYVIGIAGTLGMVAWSWIVMKRAEKRRDAAKRVAPSGRKDAERS